MRRILWQLFRTRSYFGHSKSNCCVHKIYCAHEIYRAHEVAACLPLLCLTLYDLISRITQHMLISPVKHPCTAWGLTHASAYHSFISAEA